MTQTPTLTPPQSPQQALQPQYEITDDDKKRVQRIQDAWVAYDGELEPPLKKMPDGTDPNVMSNRISPIVDMGTDFVFGKELEINVEESAPQEVQDFLDDTWGIKETRIPLLQKWEMNGGIAGTAFLRIVPNKQGKKFRLITVDPATVYVKTAPQDCETVLLWCIEYSCTEKQNGRPVSVYYREEIMRIDPDGNASQGMPDDDDTWAIQHWTRISERGMWQPAGEPILWPYPFPPLFACQNLPRPNSFWGKPDTTKDLIGMNKSLNLEQSCIMLDEILYGHPILYATGTGESVIQIQPGKIIGLPLSESKIVSVPIQSDVANALAFSENLRSDMDEQSHVPGVATGRIKDMPRGNMSGIAIELLFMPILKKTDKKRCTYGAAIIEVSKALLTLNHMNPDIKITLAWQSPLPSDDLQSLQAAVLKKQVGISDSTIQRELGYDPDEELALSQTEDAKKLQAYSRGMGLLPGQPQMGQDVAQQQQGQEPHSPFIGRQA